MAFVNLQITLQLHGKNMVLYGHMTFPTPLSSEFVNILALFSMQNCLDLL